jgi:hypothetical protein
MDRARRVGVRPRRRFGAWHGLSMGTDARHVRGCDPDHDQLTSRAPARPISTSPPWDGATGFAARRSPIPRWWPRVLWRFERLGYLDWELGMPTHVRRVGLHSDLAWHVTLANVGMGSAGSRLARRFVLRPVGGGIATPWGVMPTLETAGSLFEVNRTTARFAGRWLNFPSTLARVPGTRFCSKAGSPAAGPRGWTPRPVEGNRPSHPGDVPPCQIGVSGSSATARAVAAWTRSAPNMGWLNASNLPGGSRGMSSRRVY